MGKKIKYEFWAEFDLYKELTEDEWQNKEILDGLVGKNPGELLDRWAILDEFSRLQILAVTLASSNKAKWKDHKGKERQSNLKDYARTGFLQNKEKSGLLYWYSEGSYHNFLRVALKEMLAVLCPTNSYETVNPSLPDLSIFPRGSWTIQVNFTLRKPYISKDDVDFYIIDNPVKKEWVFKVPYVAPSQWKGALRVAMTRELANWWLGLDKKDRGKHENQKEFVKRRLQLARLFGNEKSVLVDDKRFEAYLDIVAGSKHLNRWYRRALRFLCSRTGFIQGSLHFYPTYFDRIGLEVINPHDRKTGAGKQPIYFECVPAGTPGVFSLLYVPLEKIDEQTARDDMKAVAEGIKAMLTQYGFGAKTSSGYGVAEICEIVGFTRDKKMTVSGSSKTSPTLGVVRTPKKIDFRLSEWKRELREKRNIILGHFDASWKSVNFNKREQEILKDYLIGSGLPKLNIVAQTVLSFNKFVVKFAGVFVHQTPKVMRLQSEHKAVKAVCEIGDWLVISIWLNRYKKIQWVSAYFYQVKKLSSRKKHIKIENSCQKGLYDQDNSFLYYSPRDLYRKSLFVRTPLRCWGFKDTYERNRGLKYLILNNSNPPVVYPAPLNDSNKLRFSEDLLSLLLMDTGIPIDLLPSANEYKWTSIILDLIRVTANKSLKGYRDKHRGTGLEPLLGFVKRFNSFEDYDNCKLPPTKGFWDDFGSNDYGENGISTLFVFIQDKEGR